MTHHKLSNRARDAGILSAGRPPGSEISDAQFEALYNELMAGRNREKLMQLFSRWRLHTLCAKIS